MLIKGAREAVALQCSPKCLPMAFGLWTMLLIRMTFSARLQWANTCWFSWRFGCYRRCTSAKEWWSRSLGPVLDWNKLTHELKTITNLTTFSHKCKLHIFDFVSCNKHIAVCTKPTPKQNKTLHTEFSFWAEDMRKDEPHVTEDSPLVMCYQKTLWWWV